MGLLTGCLFSSVLISITIGMSTWNKNLDDEDALEMSDLALAELELKYEEMPVSDLNDILVEVQALVKSEQDYDKIRKLGLRTHTSNYKNCPCYCRQVGESYYKCCECEIKKATCFPAQAKIKRINGDVITMADLRIGDDIMTVKDAGTPTPTKVISFLHYEPDVTGVYTHLATEFGSVISLSGSHLVYASSSNRSSSRHPRFASTLKIGDYIFTSQDSQLRSEQIVRIRTRLEKGAYVPLTESGTMLVDDVHVSCYASFDHNVAHLAMSPVRWFPWLFNRSQYIQGVLPYVHYMKLLGRTLLPNTSMRPHSQPASSVSATSFLNSTSLLAAASWGTCNL